MMNLSALNCEPEYKLHGTLSRKADTNHLSDVDIKKSSKPRTPTTALQNLFPEQSLTLTAKLESRNPSGSIKYRAARRIISQALAQGRINSRSHIVESSSGNMGAALALVCAENNLRFTCVVDPRTQSENIDLIRFYKGDVIEVSQPLNGCFLQARMHAVKEFLARKHNAFWTNQYANIDNRLAHTFGTAQEIYDEFACTLDAVCVATSSTGTLNGIHDFLRIYSPQTEIIAVDAANSVLFGGRAGIRRISGLGAGVKPDLSKDSRPHHVLKVSDKDAVLGCHRARTLLGLEIGGSSGAIVEAIFKNPALFKNKNVLAIFPDGGEKYGGTIYSPSWLSENLGLNPNDIAREVGNEAA